MLEIVPYDLKWPAMFLAERGRIAAVLGGLALRIDHNGSTAVPGLAAKPIINIQVSVRSLHPIDTYAAGLHQLGYIHRPDADDAFCPFFHKPRVWPHIYHVHVVESGGAEERRTLAFRDYLREHPHVARQYEDLKRKLAKNHGRDTFVEREAYAEAKTEFVISITERALAEGYPHEI